MQQHVDNERAAFDRGEIPEPRWLMQRQIHLADAHFTVPGQGYAFELEHTRVQLSHVVGWTHGQRRSSTWEEANAAD